MQHLTVWNRGLDAMTDGVAEVQQRADSQGFMLIRFHHACLDGDVAGDQIRGNGATGGIQRGQIIQHRRIPDGGMFDRLREALVKLAVRQRAQRFGIHDHQAGLVEGTQQVFPLGHIHAGLAADGGIHLRDDRRGNLHEGKSAVKDGGHEAREIAHHAAAERHDHRLAVMSRADHLAAQGSPHGASTSTPLRRPPCGAWD